MNEAFGRAGPAPTLESVLNTAELTERAFRAPDYEVENKALIAIARHMANSPATVLQKLAETALELCGAGSAGVSLVNKDGTEFYWPAIAGVWKPYIGGGTPRHFGPCGVVLDTDAVQMFTHPERYYPYLIPVSPPIEEALLTPFHVNGKAIGTVWVISHDDTRFDTEHVRLIESLGQFAAASYPLRQSFAAQEEQAQAMLDVNEALVVSSVHQHELTEKAQKADALTRISEDRLRSLVSVITDVPWTTDPDGRFVQPQPAWSAYTGQEWEELREFGWINALHPEDRRQIQETWERALQDGVLLYQAEGRIWHAASQKYRFFEARAKPMRNANGAVLEWVGACTDVDDEKRYEITLQALNEDLKSFTHAASHDLQEPLRMVMIFTQLLSRDYQGKLDPKADRYIASITEGAERMQRLLRGLREYWTANEPGDKPAAPIDCNLVFQEALGNLETAIQESGAVVTQDPLPTVMAGNGPLLQLFQNLIGNAVKYHASERTPRIHVSARRSKDVWEIAISDNGIGISADDVESIFTPFKRLHGAEYAGTGLGLAMCRKLVERYHGRIWVESTVGQGATFFFTLPEG